MNPRVTTIGVSLKAYLDPDQTSGWAARIGEIALSNEAILRGAVEMFVMPAMPSLAATQAALAHTVVSVGAQDLFWADRGAYTGAVSGADLRDIGCRLVEVGHHERRQYFGEDDQTINLKTAAAFRNSLIPVLCVGEVEEVTSSAAVEQCVGQLESALYASNASEARQTLIVAYEPVWAIGAERPASSGHINAVAKGIHQHLSEYKWLDNVRVIYGGSAQVGLLPQLSDDIDGLFLGRFAHDPESLAAILDDALVPRK